MKFVWANWKSRGGDYFELLVRMRESKPIHYNYNNEYLGEVKTLRCLFAVDFEVTLEDFMRNNWPRLPRRWVSSLRNFAFLLLEGFEGHVGDELRGLAACLATDDKESGKIRRLANASQQNIELRVVVEDFKRNLEPRGPPAMGWLRIWNNLCPSCRRVEFVSNICWIAWYSIELGKIRVNPD